MKVLVFIQLILMGTLCSAQISEDELNYYLSKSVTIHSMGSLCKPKSKIYKGETVAPGWENINDDRFLVYLDMLRLIENVRPKFIQTAVAPWGIGDWKLNLKRAEFTVQDIKNIDEDIVVQVALSEYVDNNMVDKINEGLPGKVIPDWVFEAFDLTPPDPSRQFDLQAMTYDDYLTNSKHYNVKDNGVIEIRPDITKLETKLWFYYQGIEYIDRGFECITFSFIKQMSDINGDENVQSVYAHWDQLFSKLRDYSSNNTDNRFLLITAHHETGVKDPFSNNLLFDFNTDPCRPIEVGVELNENGGDTKLGVEDGSIYGKSIGGVNPSGWVTSSNPAVVFLDNYGNNYIASGKASLGEAGGPCKHCPYQFDEITWFAMQPEDYRNQWLKYAYNRVRCFGMNYHFSLPVKTTILPIGVWDDTYVVPQYYLANEPNNDFLPVPPQNSSGVPIRDLQKPYQGFNQENTIKNLINDEIFFISWPEYKYNYFLSGLIYESFAAGNKIEINDAIVIGDREFRASNKIEIKKRSKIVSGKFQIMPVELFECAEDEITDLAMTTSIDENENEPDKLIQNGEYNSYVERENENTENVREESDDRIETTFNIFPNPGSSGIFKIASNDNKVYEVKVLDILGNTIATSKTDYIDVSSQPKGLYVLHIYDGKNVRIKKIIYQ